MHENFKYDIFIKDQLWRLVADFKIKNPRHAEHWQAQDYPVMLVNRIPDGQIRWMNVSDYLKQRAKNTKQIIFDGEPFTALSVVRLRDRLFR